MKKILSVSILAMLTVAPLAANATDPHRYAGVTIDETTTAQNGGNDTQKVASTAYVKGAYNAAIGVVDTESARVDGILGGKTTGANVTHSTLYKNSDDTIYGNLEKLETAIDTLTNNSGSTYVTKSSASAADNKATGQTTLHYATGDGEHVGSNLAALDAQVYTNKTGIDTLTTNTTVTNAGNYLTADGNVAANLGALDAAVGQKSTLTTTAKDTIVAAINEVDNHADANAAAIGTMANLGTATGTNLASDNGNLVVAVNKLDADMGSLASLNTTEKDSLVGAINEVRGNGTLSDNGTYIQSTNTVAQNLSALDTQVKTNADNISDNATNIGTLSGLTTTAQGNLVAAVNEVNSKQLTVYSGWNGGAAPTAASSTVALTKTNN